MKKLYACLLLVISCWLLILPENASAQNETICPLYRYALHDGYASYYAAICEDGVLKGFGSWDGPTAAPTGGCNSGCCAPRIVVSATTGLRVSTASTTMNLADEICATGATKKAGLNHKAQPDNGATRLSRFRLNFTDPDTDEIIRAHAYIFAVPAKPAAGDIPEIPAALFGVGQETAANNPPEITADADQVKKTGDYCYEVTLGTMVFRIVRKGDAQAPSPEEASAKASASNAAKFQVVN